MIALALLFAAATTVDTTAASPVPSPVSAVSEQQALFDEAMSGYHAKNCEQAMPALRTLVATGYRPVESAYALRDCYLAKFGSAEKSAAALEAEVKANPADAVAHSNLGCFYLMLQKRDEAKTELIKALELAPNDVDAHANLAFWYASVGQAHTAVREYEDILKTNPDEKRSLTELCTLIAEQENDAKRAEPFCARAAKGQESNEMLGVTLGLVRMRTGDLDGAEQAFQTVLAADPKAKTARTFYGVSRLQRNDLDGAQKSFESVLALDPTDSDAHVNLARVYQARKDFSKAAGEYKAAYRESGNGMLLGALVKVYLQRFYYLIVFALLAVMGVLLYRYLDVRSPEPNPA